MLNFNSAPYFDDFDPLKSFHRILFRGGQPVQTRELTQLQTILQNQISSFGNYVFRNGQCIVPGSQTYIQNVYEAVVTITNDDHTFDDLSDYATRNIRFKGGLSQCVMDLVYYVKLSDTEAKLYLAPYRYSEDGSANLFVGGETINFYDPSEDASDETEETTEETAQTYQSQYITDEEYDSFVTDDFARISTQGFSPATLATVLEGIYYVNGYFVTNSAQTIVVSATTHEPTATVGFYIKEEVITPYDDNSLFDNSVGYEAENSSGAHRYKINLVLSLKGNPEYDIEYDFITLSMIKNGQVILDNSVLEKTDNSWLYPILAQRTYEESGNYTVKEYNFETKEKIDIDDDGVETVNKDNYEFVAKRGESYVGGYRLDNSFESVSIDVPKARKTVSLNNNLINVKYGNYILITDIDGSLPAPNALIVLKRWSVSGKQSNETNRTGIETLGYASVYNVELEKEAYESVPAIYRLYIYDTQFNDGIDLSEVRSISTTTGTKANVVALVTVSGLDGYFDIPCEYYNARVNTPTVRNTVLGIATPSDDMSADSAKLYVKPYKSNKTGYGTYLPSKAYIQFDVTTKTTARVESISYLQDADNSGFIIPFSSGVVRQTDDYSYFVRRSANVTIPANSGSVIFRNTELNVLLSSPLAIDSKGVQLGTELRDSQTIIVSRPEGSETTAAHNAVLYYSAYIANGSIEPKTVKNVFPMTIEDTTSGQQTTDSYAAKITESVTESVIDAYELTQSETQHDVLSLDAVYAFGSDGEFIVKDTTEDWTDRFVFNNPSDHFVRKNAYMYYRTGKIPETAGNIGYAYTCLNNSSADVKFAISTVSSYMRTQTTADNAVTDTDFLYDIPKIKSNGTEHRLCNCIDFRPKYKPYAGYVYGSYYQITDSSSSSTLNKGTSVCVQLQSQYPYGVLNTYPTDNNNASTQTVVGKNVIINGCVGTVASIHVYDDPIYNFVEITMNSASDADALRKLNFQNIPIVYSDGSVSSIISPYSENLSNNSHIQLDYVYYLPRRDIVYLQSNGELKLEPGVPADNPKLPDAIENEYQMPLASLYVPAFTFYPNEISITPYVNRHYTMKDIGKIDDRVTNLENAMSLSMLETSVNNMSIIDSDTGLNRFKTGYVVDGFTSLNLVDYTSETIGHVDDSGRCFRPTAEQFSIDTVLVDKKYISATGQSEEIYSTNYRISDNGVLSIDYDEEILIEQDAPSNWQNINPFTSYNWTGAIDISPRIDVWQDTATVESYSYNFSLTRGKETNRSWSVDPNTYYNNLISYLKEKEILKSDVYYEGL